MGVILSKILKLSGGLLKLIWGLYQVALGALLLAVIFSLFWGLKYFNYFKIKNLEFKNPKVTAFILKEEDRVMGDSVLYQQVVKARSKREKKVAIWWDWTPWDSIPSLIKEVVLVAEDGKFYKHHGFDWEELQFALVANHQQGKNVRGASTITQQVIKNLYLSADKSYERKFKESIMTVLIENYVSKERILEIYLNIAQFAPGVFGVGAGAEHHFGKSLDKLSYMESIELIAMLPSPNKWSPHSSYRKYRRHKMRMIKNLALYNKYKKKIPEDVLSRFSKYAEQEKLARWKKLNDRKKSHSLDTLLYGGKKKVATDSNLSP